MKAHVYVTLKREVLDPQGDAVRRALDSLGYKQIKGARIGKFIELELDEKDKNRAQASLEGMCEQLLSNPVIEDFRFELIE